MKLLLRSLALTAVLAAALPASAQEKIPAEEAQRVAHKLHDTIGIPSDAPFPTDIDPDKPNGFKVGDAGLMALPDRKLTTAALDQVTKEPLPVGQLWSLQASLATNGRAITNDQLRLVKVSDGDKSREVQLYYLGAAKNDAGELQLLIFAKDKMQPVLRVPLKKGSASSSASPLEIEGRKQSDDTGLLTIRILGEYTAEVTVMKPE